MTFQELKKLVVQEAVVLRREASIKELRQLNRSILNPERVDLCIYGQMTGHCFSNRATELIELACPKPIMGILPEYLYEGTLKHHNAGQLWSIKKGLHSDNSRPYQWSAIEVYITLAKAKPKVLIDFLQGDINQKLNANML